MDHVVIVKKSWGLTQKILTGEKRIESRWYKSKHFPWGKIEKNDTVYFKNSGEPISIRTEVEQVISLSDLNPKKVKQILYQYGKDDGINSGDISKFFESRWRLPDPCLPVCIGKNSADSIFFYS